MNKKERPIIKISRTPFEVLIELVAFAGILAHIFILINSWDALPDIVPTHFGASGEADRWGSKNFLLAVNIGLYLMLTVINGFPHLFNYGFVKITAENAREQYYNARLMMNLMKMEMVWMFVCIQWFTIEVALGKAVGLDSTVMINFMVILAATLYFFIRRMKEIG